MDALALLCNLHADGPTTLGRLRELGCEGIDELEALSRADLVWALQTDGEGSERFRREAGLLAARLGDRAVRARRSDVATERIPDEPVPADARPATSGVVGTVAVARTGDGPGARYDDAVAEPGPTVRGGLAAQHQEERARPSAEGAAIGAGTRPGPTTAERGHRREGSLLQTLLKAWRLASGRTAERGVDEHGVDEHGVDEHGSEEHGEEGRAAENGVARTPAAARPTVHEARPRTADLREDDDADEPAVELPPHPPRQDAETAHGAKPKDVGPPVSAGAAAPAVSRSGANDRGTPLARVGFQGVEADYADELARLGIGSVEEFLAAQPLELAGRSTMRYTVLLRMQFLARRELERTLP
ncbi:MAG: hypothetical protein R3F34_12855 [Planctomycetota bacterium]